MARPRKKPVSTPNAANGNAPLDAPLDAPLGTLSRDQLERYLWPDADILRGSIDSSDCKNYIFDLLFLKRLSDRFEEECEALVKAGIDLEAEDEHQFFVPRDARWPELSRHTSNIGERLNTACEKLEDHNATLQGVLAGIDFNDERKLGSLGMVTPTSVDEESPF